MESGNGIRLIGIHGLLTALLVLVSVCASVISGINFLIDEHKAEHYANVLVCGVSHDTPKGKSEEKDDWWVKSPQGSFNLQAGLYNGTFYTKDNTNQAVKPGKTYRFTYHGGSISSKFVTEAQEIKGVGTCGE